MPQISNPIIPGSLGNPGTNGAQNFAKVLPSAIGLAFIIGSLIFFAMLIQGAISWIASGGDKQKLEDSRSRITNALTGLVILFATFALIQVVQTFFGISILTLDITPLIIK